MTRARLRQSRRVPPDQGLCYRCRPNDTRGAIMEQTVGAGMGIVVFLLIVAGTGLLIGALARLALPGPDPMSWPATLGYGLVGSVLGGLVSRLLHVPRFLDIVIAIAFAAGLIWFFRRRRSSAAPPVTPERRD
jgi:uncharacterized membrane protein YeaQ/YmgE (transglycosylase-associated protein family)